MTILRPFQFIAKTEIEAVASRILSEMEKSPQYFPTWPLDASRVAEFVGLDLVWDRIPADNQGMIAARILPLQRLIEINEDIPVLRGGFGESTIAHEIGHWVFHIDHDAVKRYLQLQKKGLHINVEPLLCRTQEGLQGIEWQAQYFASCLLMPRYILEDFKKQDLDKWHCLYKIAKCLGVTISNLVHRLKDLGWIELPEGSREILILNKY